MERFYTERGTYVGATLGTTTTGVGGTYSLNVPFTGDVVVEVSGGTYTDEATNASTALTAPLKVVLNANGGSVTGVVTPLTTMAASTAGPMAARFSQIESEVIHGASARQARSSTRA